MRNKIFIFAVAFMIFNIGLINALDVVKESPQKASINDLVEIKIHISNPSLNEKEFLVEEIIPNDVEIVEPSKFNTRKNDALDVMYYDWKINVNPNSIKTITYKIRPLIIGRYSIQPTKVTDESIPQTYYSNSINFNVLCTPDNFCDASENSITCPQDCMVGGGDGLCDYKADSICDPDCDTDPDCKNFSFKISYLIIPFMTIILIVLILILYMLFKRKKNLASDSEVSEIKYYNPEEAKDSIINNK